MKIKIIEPLWVGFVDVLVFIALPIYTISLISERYPEVMAYREVYLYSIITILGPLAVVTVVLEHMSRKGSMRRFLFSVAHTTVALAWLYLILGQGVTEIFYRGFRIRLEYYALLYMSMGAISLRYLLAGVEMLSHRDEERKPSPRAARI